MKMIQIKKKKPIAKNIRIALFAGIIIGIIISAYAAYATSQGSRAVEKTIPISSYKQIGNFNYLVYLTNNTVYNTTVLYPGEGNIFKTITDHINASITYSFICNKTAIIQGTYTVIAQIQTDIWSKEYTLVPKTEFTTDHFSTTLLINYTRFENILNDINTETGVNAQSPALLITCNIEPTIIIDQHTVNDPFTPYLNISLGENIIKIQGEGLQSATGVIEETQTVIQPPATLQRNISVIVAILLTIFLIGFILFSENKPITVNKTQKKIKKIMKKYGDWIVDVGTLPTTKEGKTITVKSMDDLTKISEELGKPILQYMPSSDQHTFYVLDQTLQYEYSLLPIEKIKKKAQCPQCGFETIREASPGEKLQVNCPNCGNTGVISFEKKPRKKSKKSP